MVSLYISVALLIMGTINTVLMLETMGRKRQGPGYFSAHRWLGRAFAVVFLGVFIFMLPRAAFLNDMPVSALVHALSGLTLLPLVLCKVLLARRYRLFHETLPSFGFLIVFFCYTTIIMSGILVTLFRVQN
ncbi:MAG: hypothetical protein QG577_2186 [Thermodesulfobacteriota bacterium]|nr:hypothetical protein [Thermodesulfobacteriota bacterium]